MNEQKIQTEDQILGEWIYCGQHLRPHQSGWCTVGLEDKVGLGPFTGASDVQSQKAMEKCRHLGLKIGGEAKDKNYEWWKANKSRYEETLKGRYILIADKKVIAAETSKEPLQELAGRWEDYIIINNGVPEVRKGHRIGLRGSPRKAPKMKGVR